MPSEPRITSKYIAAAAVVVAVLAFVTLRVIDRSDRSGLDALVPSSWSAGYAEHLGTYKAWDQMTVNADCSLANRAIHQHASEAAQWLSQASSATPTGMREPLARMWSARAAIHSDCAAGRVVKAETWDQAKASSTEVHTWLHEHGHDTVDGYGYTATFFLPD